MKSVVGLFNISIEQDRTDRLLSTISTLRTQRDAATDPQERESLNPIYKAQLARVENDLMTCNEE